MGNWLKSFNKRSKLTRNRLKKPRKLQLSILQNIERLNKNSKKLKIGLGLSKTRLSNLVNLLHSGGILCIPFQRWHVHVVSGSILHITVVVIDAKAELDHPVDPLSMDLWVLEAEAGGQETGLEQKHHQILHRLIILVCFGTLAQVLNDAVVGPM